MNNETSSQVPTSEAPVSAGVLPPEQVAEIQARAALATPGPWKEFTPGSPRPMSSISTYCGGILAGTGRYGLVEREGAQSRYETAQEVCYVYCDPQTRRFLLASRTDVPALCASHETLRADKERLERELAEARQIAKYAREMVDYVADTLPMRNCDKDDPSSFPMMRCWVSEAMVVQARDIQRCISAVESK